MAQSELRKHVALPIPNPKDLSKETLSKPEVLSAIISNLDKSHQTVRNNIYTAAKAKQETLKTNPPPSTQSNSTSANKAAANTILLANLNAPAPSHDPCMPPTGAIPPPPASIIQIPPPPQIQLAQETFQQLDYYDRNARRARQFYKEAQDKITNAQDRDPDPRRRRSSGASIPGANSNPHPPGLGLSTSGSYRGPGGYGNVNASPAERMRGGPGSANASPWGGGSANVSPRDPRLQRAADASPRDPRLQRR